MANRRFRSQFNYSFKIMPVTLDCNAVIGASGAIGTFKHSGVASITRLSTGTYQVQLEDNYNRYTFGGWGFVSPLSGSNVTAGSFSPGTVYVITSPGTTNWQAIGLPAGITPAVGATFLASGAGSGTGTAQVTSHSGIFAVEVIGDVNTMLAPVPSAPLAGGYVTFQCLNASGAATDPASGSVMALTFQMENGTSTSRQTGQTN